MKYRVCAWYSTRKNAFKIEVLEGPQRGSSHFKEDVILFEPYFSEDVRKPGGFLGLWDPNISDLSTAIREVFDPEGKKQDDSQYVIENLIFDKAQGEYCVEDSTAPVIKNPHPVIVSLEIEFPDEFDIIRAYPVYRVKRPTHPKAPYWFDDDEIGPLGERMGEPTEGDTSDDPTPKVFGKCSTCKGKGVRRRICSACGGNPDEPEDSTGCATCDGEGVEEVICSDCKGRG
jgi:hypothetical protein